MMRSRNLKEKPKKRLLRKRVLSKMQSRGFCVLKYIQKRKKYESPKEVQVLKILISTGDSYFKIQSLKVGINRQPLCLPSIFYQQQFSFQNSNLCSSAREHFIADSILVFTGNLCIFKWILGILYRDALGSASNIQK